MGAGQKLEGMGRVLQILMFVVNLIIWIGSILLFVFGGLSLGGEPYLNTIFDGALFSSGAIILIVVGVVAFIISFLGCFGALKESKCMILTYFIIVLVLFILLMVGGILGLVFKGQGEAYLKKGMTKSLRSYKTDSDSIITRDWDAGQTEMKCCGVEDRNDYINFQVTGFNSNRRYPRSCCRPDRNSGQRFECQRSASAAQVWERGCFSVARAYAVAHASEVGGAGIGIAVLMICGMVCSMMLYLMLRKQK